MDVFFIDFQLKFLIVSKDQKKKNFTKNQRGV